MRGSEAINYAFDAAGSMFSPFKRAFQMGRQEGSTLGDMAYAAFGTSEKSALSVGAGKHTARSAAYANTMAEGKLADELGGNLVKEGDERQLSLLKIGGGIAGLGLGYRFISGGGLYRDKNGDTDLAGIPFV